MIMEKEIEFDVIGIPNKLIIPLDELARKTINLEYKPASIKKIIYSISVRAIIVK